MASRSVTDCSTTKVIRWPCEVFSYTRGLAPTGGQPKMDLTGRGRILVYGPFQELEPGKWRIEVEFDLDPEGGEIFLRFEWGGGLAFETFRTRCSRAGRYRVAVSNAWSDARAVELRIWVDRATLFGSMEMLGATVRRIAENTQIEDSGAGQNPR